MYCNNFSNIFELCLLISKLFFKADQTLYFCEDNVTLLFLVIASVQWIGIFTRKEISPSQYHMKINFPSEPKLSVQTKFDSPPPPPPPPPPESNWSFPYITFQRPESITDKLSVAHCALRVTPFTTSHSFSSDNKTKLLKIQLQLNFGKPLLEQYSYQNVS